jgi:hypothetical protein
VKKAKKGEKRGTPHVLLRAEKGKENLPSIFTPKREKGV